MVLSDKRVLWHPRNHNRFVVGGSSQITLYEWAAEYPEIRHITSQHDLHHMKCFAWSPDPAFDDLLAVGLSTGRVDLIRLEASKHARQPNILSSGPSVHLPVRTSRSCNALAFSQKDPNYLAVGLDKIRNDSSLVIWDISSARPTLAIASLNEGLDHASLADSLHSRPQPQIPRTDNRADSRIIQQHALTEIVSAVSFLPELTHVLLAGVSHRWLRMFDLRSATPAVTNVASKVQEIATDPFDAHRVACFGDSTVTVWDQRKFTQPLLQFTEKDASADGARIRSHATYTHIEFSNVRRNCLAALEKEASYVRFWDIAETRSSSDGNPFGALDYDSKQPREALRSSRRSWANLPWPTTQSQPTSNAPASTPPGERIAHVLADTRRTKTFPRALSSFAVVPNPTDASPLATSVMVVNKDGDLEMYQVHDTPKQALWSARGEFGMGSGTGFKFISGYQDDDPFEDNPSDIRQPSALPTPYSQFERSSRSRSAARRDDSSRRGRTPKNEASVPPGSALFARDEDPVPPSGVATQLARNVGDSRNKRAYSPASFRKYAKSSERGDPPLKDFLNSDRNGSRSRERNYSPARGKHRDDPLLTARPAGNGERMQSPAPSKRKPSAVRHAKQKGINHVVEEDISMVMRKRALKGYCLSKPFDNSTISHEDDDAARSHDDSLSEVWAWIHHSRDVLCVPTPKIHGFDFSFQGLIGLLEGFAPIPLPEGQSVDDTPLATQRTLLLDVPGTPHPFAPTTALFERQPSRRSHSPADDLYGNWNAAVTTLVERRGADKSTWKPSAPTTKLHQRQLGLELCGWSLRDEELKAAVKRWEKEGQISRAACWLVFIRQYAKAMDLLMRSNDEKHRMMSGTIAALTPHGSSPLKNPELREHYSRLSVRLQDPYFRMMIIHMGVGDWLEVLEEDVIPFRERLAIAFQFLDDRSLKSYLQRIVADASQTGNIDAIIVTGLTKQGLDVLQAYVDRTGDVQTVAIMGSYVSPVKFHDRRVERWLNAYREMLDGFRLHPERVGFDIERGQLVLDALQNGEGLALSKDLVPPQILIRCHYCNKPVNTTEITGVGPNKARPTTCPNCSRSLPKCSVCLMTLAIIDDASRELDLGYGSFKDTLDDAIVICQTCRHGGHASHILEWFLGEDGRQAHGMCPVAGCDCRCADEL